MKGIVLAGGTGTRLHPLTKVTNKHLLSVYDKPMIYYPLFTLRDSGVTDIMIILGGNSVGDFINLLGDGEALGVSLTYRFQSQPNGIAGALKLAESFSQDDDVAVCLGDNIFSETPGHLPSMCENSRVFLSLTDRPSSFGIAELGEDSILSIEEKPKQPKSNYAVTGLYLYKPNIWSILPTLVASKRNELEITDVNNWYIKNSKLDYSILNNCWHDAGSIESLSKASNMILESYATKE